MADEDEVSDYGEPSYETEDQDDRMDELEQRLSELEEDRNETGSIGASILYVFGSSLAMTLSWSRAQSIVGCVLHGVLSWVYVAYFVLTR